MQAGPAQSAMDVPQRKRFRDEDMLVHTIPIPKELNDLIAVIIGPGGSTVKSICMETGVKRIEITKDTEPRTALIKGATQEAVNNAAAVINSILYDKNERERIRQTQMLQRSASGMGGQPSAHAASAPPSVQIPPSYDPANAAAAQQQYYGQASPMDPSGGLGGAHGSLDAQSQQLQQLYSQNSNAVVVQQLQQNVNAMLSLLNDISTRLGSLENRVSDVERKVAISQPAPACAGISLSSNGGVPQLPPAITSMPPPGHAPPGPPASSPYLGAGSIGGSMGAPPQQPWQ
uniref:K Homology domain-containing protein n=1 Tax=Coccolithus braarudii TaxID=221442 RepID=A0A7S0KZQ4_9EUKA|mmetsp:Transcript_12071/g.26078  ORF Transcript_12071/g.26078 Transcript_12071/m.26078 type:complete len:289 (+) Transcript_12071:246-1112(+)